MVQYTTNPDTVRKGCRITHNYIVMRISSWNIRFII